MTSSNFKRLVKTIQPFMHQFQPVVIERTCAQFKQGCPEIVLGRGPVDRMRVPFSDLQGFAIGINRLPKVSNAIFLVADAEMSISDGDVVLRCGPFNG